MYLFRATRYHLGGNMETQDIEASSFEEVQSIYPIRYAEILQIVKIKEPEVVV